MFLSFTLDFCIGFFARHISIYIVINWDIHIKKIEQDSIIFTNIFLHFAFITLIKRIILF